MYKNIELCNYCANCLKLNVTQGVLEQIKDVENHIPFSLRGFDCDNGGGFLNYIITLMKTSQTPSFYKHFPSYIPFQTIFKHKTL